MKKYSDMNEYAKEVEKTAIYPEKGKGTPIAVSYVTLGLNGEAGEVAEKIKKWIRDFSLGYMTAEQRVEVQKELGDVAWYWIRLHEELGLDPAVTLGKNVAKLADRYERGQLGGSGDDR